MPDPFSPLRGRPRPLRLLRRFVALLGSGEAARQSLIALMLNSTTSFVAGAALGSITGTFKEFPGLLVLVPAAIGLRRQAPFDTPLSGPYARRIYIVYTRDLHASPCQEMGQQRLGANSCRCPPGRQAPLG